MTFDLTPVDYDPFEDEATPEEEMAASDTGYVLTPVDFDPFADPQEEPAPEETSGFVGAFTGGIENTFRSLKSSLGVIYGNDQGVQDTAMQSLEDPNTTIEMEQFRAQLAQYGEPEGVWDALKNVAKAAWDNPVGVLHEVAGQLPNSAAVMAPGAAGAAAGSLVLGPAGFIIGGILGMGFGNISIETGAAANEKAMSGNYDRREALEAGFIKGGVITAVDSVTMGVTKILTGAAGNAILKATEKVLIEEGVDLASDVAVKAAASSPRIAKKIAAATKAGRMGNKAAHATAFAGEMVSEGVGEYAGSSLAPGMDADLTDAVLESLLSLPQSTGDLFIGKSLNLLDKKENKGGNDEIGAQNQEDQKTAFAFQEHDQESDGAWEDQINQQNEAAAFRNRPADQTDIAVQGMYAENQRQMDSMASAPDFSMKGNNDLLKKNVEDFRREKAMEESEQGWENRRQAMMATPDQHEFNRALQDRPDESAMPLPGEMPGFQRGLEHNDDEVKYTPFSGLAEQMDPQPRQPDPSVVTDLPEQEPVHYDDGLDVSSNAEFVPSSVVDQNNFQSALGDNFGVQDLSVDDIPETKPVFEHEVEPDKVNTNPTEAQKEAGNYKKDHIKIDGHQISIENPDGSTRKGTDESGKKWESTMNGHYGYFKRTMGKDGDQVDVVVKPGTETSPKVFVVDQVNPGTGEFDEHKVIMGADSAEEAQALYMSNYEKGWKGFGAITEMGQDDFKSWVKDGTRTKKPAGALPTVKKSLRVEQKPAQAKGSEPYSPGERVTWENKKGHVFTGEIVKQSKKGGSVWHVRKPDGKITFVNESNLRSHEAATTTDEGRQVDSQAIKPVKKKSTGTTYLNDNTPIDFEYQIIEADDLVVSHNDDLSVNKDFPAELQPRERSRKGSMMQIDSIASKLNPDRLGESSSAAQGAPIIGKDSNVVESGNGRTLAIRKAYLYGEKGHEYKQWLLENAKGFGVSQSDVTAMINPVLVRKRQTDIEDLSRFTQQANETDTAKLSATEQAVVDANNLTPDDLALFRPDQDGNINSASNKGFIDNFLGKMSPEEQAGYLTADGRANKQLIDRIQAAVFQKAYESEELLALSAEEANPDIKNILNGLTRSVTNFVKARGLDGDLAGTGIVEDVIAGIELLRQARREYPDIKAGKGRSAIQAQLRQTLDQGVLFGKAPTEEVKEIASFLAENVRSGKRIGEFFDSMGVRLRAYISDLSQAEMFGTKKELSARDLIELSKEFLNEKYEDRQQDLFAEPTKQREGTDSKASDSARGNQGRNEDSGRREPESQEPEVTPKTNPTKQTYGSRNKLFTADAAEKARELLKKKLSGAQLNSGIDPEIMLAGIQLAGYHIEAGARTFAEYSKAMIQDVGETVKPYLRSFYEGVRHYPGFDAEGMTSPQKIDEITQNTDTVDELKTQENENVPQHDTSTNIERDSGNTGTGDALGKESVSDGPGPAERIDGDRIQRTDKRSLPGSGEGRPGHETPPVGKRGDQSPYSTDGPDGSESGPAGSHNDTRGGDVGFDGQQPERISAETVVKTAQKGTDLKSRITAQKKAAFIKTVKSDLSNIQNTLPLLHPGQHDDVFFAEKRFSQPDGHGVMFTNGTGTGKTFSGLGIIKRFARDGKKNILIIAPDNVIINAWIEAAKLFDLSMHKLSDTKDAGNGITITTYANFRDNKTLVSRGWDLVIADESHELSMNKAGGETGSLKMFRALTKHPRGVKDRAELLHADLLQERNDAYASINAARASSDRRDWENVGDLEKVARKADKAWSEAVEDVREDVTRADQEGTRTKAVFLSATPFAYEKNIDYAEGYLFSYGEERDDTGYNSTDSYQQFMVQHFGYRMRYNKLTEPDKEVNRGLMQRQFNSWLKKEGVLSSRVLSVDHDYDRRFVLTESAIGQKIDEGFEFLSQNHKEYGSLHGYILDQFDYLKRRYLLEAIKAREVVPIIQEHLALGRKVVVFHDYIKGGAKNPFDVRKLVDPSQKDSVIKQEAQAFIEARPDLVNLPIRNLPSPLIGVQSAFPELLVVNGQTVTKKEMQENINRFNNDKTGPAVIMVQSDKDKGWSGHDTTGKHPRVLINLGLPTRPTRAIQQEGRIYRVGQSSDAMFRYLNTGTNWERWAFASTIAQRASAAENLAMGEEARALQDSFINAFEESDTYPAGYDGEGTGGKAQDAANNQALTEWDRAISFYFGQQKKTSRTKAREGADYFATPEPLGLKMVEWAGIKSGDKILEPSAGHGAIARWFPENIDSTAIEPSTELSSRLKMVAPDSKVLQEKFESHHITNKYDAVVMNPPFGTGGKTAMEHIEKAFSHLREGGRIVALVPRGPAMDKRMDKFLYGEDSNGKSLNPNAHMVAEYILPQVTFERAGTKVASRIVVIDKVSDNTANIQSQSARDYSSVKDIKEFFSRIENTEAPARGMLTNEYEASPKENDVLDSFGLTVSDTGHSVYPFKVTGDTYRHRFAIKSVGDRDTRRWDSDEKAWFFKEDPSDSLLGEITKDQPKYSTTSEKQGLKIPGQGMSKEQIIAAFPGQEVTVNDDGSISIKFKNGRGVKVKTVDHIGKDDYRFAVQSGRMTKNGVVLGKYRNGEIILNKNHAHIETVIHENLHLLADLGILTGPDAAALDSHRNDLIKKGEYRYKLMTDPEENRANTLAQLVNNREKYRNRSVLHKIIQQFMDFLDALTNIGKQSARKLAREYESGEIYSRDTGSVNQVNQNKESLFSTSDDQAQPVSDSDFMKQKFHEKGTFLENMKGAIEDGKTDLSDKAIASTVDSLHFIKKRLGDEAYKLHRVLTGIKSATFSMFLEHGQLSWDGNALTVDQRKEGFLPFLRSIGDDWQSLFYWIAAKRAEELDAQGRENWLKKEDRDRIFKIVGDQSEKGESWASLNDKFQEFNKNILDVMTESGLIDPESREAWESNVYIPFYRVIEDDATRGEFLSGPTGSKKHISSQIKRLKGGQAQLGDPLENILKNWMFGLDAAARNKARSTAFDVGNDVGIISEVPKKDLVKILGAQNTTRFAVVKAGKTKARAIFDTREDALTEVAALKSQGKGPHRVEPRKETKVLFGSMKDFGILSFQKEGKPVYFKTEDEDLYQALAEVNTAAFNNLFMKMMGGAKRMLSYSATFGPAFRLRNMIRDSVHTAVVSKSFRPFVDSAIGFVDSMKESQDYIEFMASGFGFGSSYVSSDDPETGAKFIKKILKTEGQRSVDNILNTPRKMLALWNKIGSASENAARVGLYKNLKKQGASKFDAGFEGRDLMDFSMHGNSQSVQTIARIVPFLNARVQGLYKLGRAAKENPKAFLLKASMLTAASLLLWSAYKDDDRYKELEDWDKWTYYHFWLGDDHFRIPKPFEIGALFSSLPETVANVMNGTEEGAIVWEWFKHTAHDVFNVDMPQLFKPMVETSFNYDSFRGRAIVPDHMAKLKPSEQFTPWTSDTIRAIGDGFNMSPMKLEHLVDGYFSTIGSMVLFMTDAVTRAAAGYPSRMKGSSNPFLLKIHDPYAPRSTKYVTRFYDLYSKVDSVNRTFNNYRKLGQKEDAREYYIENRDLLNPRVKKSLNSIRKALAEANRAQKRVLRSKKLSSVQKREQVDKINRYKTKLTKRLFDRIK